MLRTAPSSRVLLIAQQRRAPADLASPPVRRFHLARVAPAWGVSAVAQRPAERRA